MGPKMVETEIVMLVYWFEMANKCAPKKTIHSSQATAYSVLRKCVYGAWSSQSACRTWNCFAVRGLKCVMRNIENHRRTHFSFPSNLCFPHIFYSNVFRRFCCWLLVLVFERVANYFMTTWYFFFHSIYYFQNWYFLCAVIFFSVCDNGFVNTMTGRFNLYVRKILMQFISTDNLIQKETNEKKKKKEMIISSIVHIFLLCIDQMSCVGGTFNTARIRTISSGILQCAYQKLVMNPMKTIPIEFTSTTMYLTR